jgi:hypothetical protein
VANMAYIDGTNARLAADPYAPLRELRERKRATRRKRLANRVKDARKRR